MKIVVEHNIKNVMRDLDLLNKGLHDKAMVSAINKTATKAKAEMKRAVTSEFNILARDVGGKLRIKRANRKNLEAVLDPFAVGRRRSMNVIRFMEKKVTLAEGRRRKKSGTQNQLRFKIKKKGGLQTIKGAFIGNKGRTVFRRTTDARHPIEAVSTVGVPSMFNTKRINKRVRNKIRKDFPIEFDRAANFHIARFNKK